MSKTISPLLHLIFSINETISSEREEYKMETEALEYHTRAMATATESSNREKFIKLELK
jgi:hypothetical protein